MGVSQLSAEPEARERSSGLLNRRRFLKMSALAALGGAAYGCEFERHALTVEHRTIGLSGLADGLHGFRIVQISDIHYEEFTEPFFVRTVVQRVNDLKADLVVITGDYISEGPLPKHIAARFSYKCAALLKGITCPLRYAILGNHDVFVNMAMVTDALVTHGIAVLSNQYVPVERNGGRFWLAGVGDVSARLAKLEKAVPPPMIKGSDPVVLLSHEPDFADHVARYGGVDLMLSGHSHGGQVRLPFVGPLILPPLGEKYVEGLFRVGKLQLYVNRGIGTVGLPVRVLCRPEITVHTLTPA